MRQDLKLKDSIVAKGWEVQLNVKDRHVKIPAFSLTFKKGNKVVWHCSKGWVCAEFDGFNYINHRYDKDLESVIERESR